MKVFNWVGLMSLVIGSYIGLNFVAQEPPTVTFTGMIYVVMGYVFGYWMTRVVR